jgi:RNAse (barnase) inhibitor barstar
MAEDNHAPKNRPPDAAVESRVSRSHKTVVEIDGQRITSLEAFYNEISGMLLQNEFVCSNLDSFNDVLRGGFGTPEGGFVLRWKDSQQSRESLGFGETVRYLERKLTTCHPLNVGRVQEELADARAGSGMTLFDILVEIIQDHGPGGTQADDGIILELL